MSELPGINLLIITILADEVATLADWQVSLFAGDSD